MTRPYHHGDLRSALLEEALVLIREQGPESFTLREIARRVGVSHAAPYRHFPSKSALLAAIAGAGSTLLREAIEEALAATPDTRAKFLAAGLAYVRFALDHPAHFRVMFFVGGAYEADAEAGAARSASFDTLLVFIRAAQRDGLLRPGDARATATPIWAMHHGLACLAVGGLIPVERAALKRTVDRAHDALLDGLVLR